MRYQGDVCDNKKTFSHEPENIKQKDTFGSLPRLHPDFTITSVDISH